jgi:hypothetical protein
MPLPLPEPGLVICYEFLWSHERQAGFEAGSKKRPCAIVLAARTENGQTPVTVAPLTHSVPQDPSRAVEIPTRVKQHLGLDSERSWIVLDELNRFIWPGFDLYAVPGGRPGQYDYGFLPPLLFERVVMAIIALDGNARRIERTE